MEARKMTETLFKALKSMTLAFGDGGDQEVEDYYAEMADSYPGITSQEVKEKALEWARAALSRVEGK